jgi:hypothetical protein
MYTNRRALEQQLEAIEFFAPSKRPYVCWSLISPDNPNKKEGKNKNFLPSAHHEEVAEGLGITC